MSFFILTYFNLQIITFFLNLFKIVRNEIFIHRIFRAIYSL